MGVKILKELKLLQRKDKAGESWPLPYEAFKRMMMIVIK